MGKEKKKATTHRSNKFKRADLSYGELKDLADGIRSLITHDKAMLLDEYEERSKSLDVKSIGHRYSQAIVNEMKLDGFFPEGIISKLRARCEIKVEFNEYDYEFIRRNRHLGLRYVARLMYTSNRRVSDAAKRKGIPIERLTHKFTDYDDDFIMNNYSAGEKYISQKLIIPVEEVKKRAKELYVDLNNTDISKVESEKKYRTRFVDVKQKEKMQQEGRFIYENRKKGILWLSQHLGKETWTIRRQLKEITSNFKDA
jgi:hypothetical protein